MERAERIGLGTAAAGHVLLFAALSLGFVSARPKLPPRQAPVEVSLVPDVALAPSAPAASEAASERVSPDAGEPVDAAPPPPAPAPQPQPQPEPATAPRIEPAKPAPLPKPVVKPAPQPEQRVTPQPVAKPRPVPVKQAPAKPAPVKAAPAKSAPVKAAPAKPAPASRPAPASGSPKSTAAASRGAAGASRTATAPRQRGGRLGDDFLAGLSAEKSDAKPSAAPPAAARVDAKALAGIVQAIARQIQPCADRQVDPGPGANGITTVLNLRLNRDGTLAATPKMVRQTGVDDDNQRYAGRVVELGIAAFKACAPLRLPAEYYATANGGWSNINYNWKLR